MSTNRLNLNNTDELNHFLHFNKTRVPGSKNSIEVQDYILNHFNNLTSRSEIPWEIELDNFQERGYNFTNIIVSKKPKSFSNKGKYLVLAAHYDTLLKPKGFIGAIDSAVSCGILLDIAESLSQVLDLHFQDFAYDMNLGLKFIFFDGEEAFEKWSPTDSIYGARHLYEKWHHEAKIKDIELLILLDLLGAPDPKSNQVPSYFAETHDNYNDLTLLENRLVENFPSLYDNSYQSKYLNVVQDEFIVPQVTMEDDHLPFLKAGVPVLHLIPSRFPKQWHRKKDNFHNVDLQAVNRWNLLLKAYVLEHLEITEPFTYNP
ncbi:Glutaminyl-peptide cyclotransferase [Wickerhamomyces ciferrii]|uniref:Peptide hydrolase n=1 Tax=Wickerhamomyces ciferrii (strain ATCC 14091 / BCRC 22168 / CBS 111 / JCM 3599 / NBRC 0793 / NRRL Y-1031 F-60-10) TaxID=1206466 RepID=K0KGS8_WICCF|nr:Glutaminyl-peptide cyclotransferase [Wickerhamomyces ciferrii]CCH41387.1 Glutaminyl-peptide cyclotransferase [Wickerhamomyces ciferrii]